MADKQEKKEKVEETTQVATEDHAEDEAVFVEDPAFELDYKGDCAYEVAVTIPPVNKQKKSEEMFEEIKKDVEVPGFRRGRAPRKLIERKFSKAVKGEVETKLVSAAFQKLVKDNDLHPIGMPDIDGLEEDKERADDQPLSFTLKFEVAPKVELGKYRGVKVERPVVTIVDSDIDEAVENMRSRYSVYEVLEGGVAAEGDQVIISFKGTIDGEDFVGGSADNYPYILGTKRFFPEFEEVLLGSSPGDELKCEVTLPDNSPNEKIRGKQASFTIKVNEVKRRQLPEVNDDLAKQMGYDNVADLREKVAERMREGASAQSDQVAEIRALEAIIEASKYELPKTMVENVANAFYREAATRLLSAGVSWDEVRKQEEELRAQATKDAEMDIKRMVTLNEIGEAEDIEVTDEDFEKEVESIAANAGVHSDVVLNYLEEEDRRSRTEGRLFRAKAMAVVMENAKVTDKEVTQEELESENSADE